MRIDTKHSYFSNILFAINFFCVVEIILELFVVCQNINHVLHNFCFCYINFKVTNLTLYMYLFIEKS